MKELQKDLRKIAMLNNAVSVSVAAVRGREVVFTDAFGVSDRETGASPTADTIYRAASVSKHVSAITAMTLVDEGKLDLDEDIGTYLGYEIRNPQHRQMPITMRNIMTHTSTIQDEGVYSDICAANLPAYGLSDIFPVGSPGYDNGIFTQHAPGTDYHYSNFAVGILGTVVEKLTGQHFADAVSGRVFEPLGLTASYNEDMLPEGVDIAVPYEVGKDSAAAVDSNNDPSWLRKSLEYKKKLMALPVGEGYRAAQGNMYIAPRSLAVISMMLMGGGEYRGARILSMESVREMLSVQYSDKKKSTGLNLHVYDDVIYSKRIFGHAGRAFGAITGCYMCPEDRLAAIVMTNGISSRKDAIGIAAITELVCCLFDGM